MFLKLRTPTLNVLNVAAQTLKSSVDVGFGLKTSEEPDNSG